MSGPNFYAHGGRHGARYRMAVEAWVVRPNGERARVPAVLLMEFGPSRQSNRSAPIFTLNELRESLLKGDGRSRPADQHFRDAFDAAAARIREDFRKRSARAFF